MVDYTYCNFKITTREKMTQSVKKKLYKLYDNNEFVDMLKLQAIVLGQFTRQINDAGNKGFEPWRIKQEFGRIFDEGYNYKGKK